MGDAQQRTVNHRLVILSMVEFFKTGKEIYFFAA
jgi:hypothetical protein